MESLLFVLCGVAFLLGVVVFSPVVVTVDSRHGQLRVRWLGFLEYLRPLPGTSGKARLFVLRKSVALRARRAGKEAPEEPAKPATPKPRKKGRKRGQFFMRCLGDSAIRRTLAEQLWKLIKRVGSSVTLSRSASDVSLPDPALNGMLAGALAASEWGRRSGVRVNFAGENSLFLELRFHPHRVFKALLSFVSGLPYRAMFRKWRAVSAARPQ